MSARVIPEDQPDAILTGGGDAPGLNAVIRAFVKAATNADFDVIGLEDSFDGLIEPNRWRKLTPHDVTGILRIGGTILGTTNRGNPFAYPVQTSGGTRDYSARCIEMVHELKLSALIVIGGDGTLSIAHEFPSAAFPSSASPRRSTTTSSRPPTRSASTRSPSRPTRSPTAHHGGKRIIASWWSR
jgi:6-phosphofructokinase 1